MKAKSALIWLVLSLVIIALDQWTKWVALSHLERFETLAVFPGLNWTLQFNYGAAFSFLNIPGGAQRWVFTAIAIVISAVLVVWLKRTPRTDWRTAAPLALIIGGAIGNLLDRLRLGYVVDFIDVYYKTWHWPAFNIADSAIFVAAVILIFFSFFQAPQRQES